MQTQYPTQYRGNTIYDEKRVNEIGPEHKPDLLFVSDTAEIDSILSHIGVEQDRESIIAEDSYNSLWVDTDGGEYTEVWGVHTNVALRNDWAVRLL